MSEARKISDAEQRKAQSQALDKSVRLIRAAPGPPRSPEAEAALACLFVCAAAHPPGQRRLQDVSGRGRSKAQRGSGEAPAAEGRRAWDAERAAGLGAIAGERTPCRIKHAYPQHNLGHVCTQGPPGAAAAAPAAAPKEHKEHKKKSSSSSQAPAAAGDGAASNPPKAKKSKTSKKPASSTPAA